MMVDSGNNSMSLITSSTQHFSENPFLLFISSDFLFWMSSIDMENVFSSSFSITKNPIFREGSSLTPFQGFLWVGEYPPIDIVA